MSSDSITIRLDDKRRQLGVWWQKIQHVASGIPLLLAGIDRLDLPGTNGRILAIAEIAVAAALLMMFIREAGKEAQKRLEKSPASSAHAHEHSGPEWFDVVAGVLLILEAVISTHPGGKPLYEHAILYLGIVTLFTGLAHGVLSGFSWKRRFVRVDDAGLRARLSPFRKFNVAWSDVIDIRLGERSVIVVTKEESHEIPLSHYGNAIEIRTAVADWRERKARALSR
ncbi:MAG: hypothetical protein ABI884_08595 [Gemmatimonadota bacterium]